ncbi:hypothetical protein Ataiwa_40210 [Algoriphagus taiwanensis]|uniref:Uncharacterized protein n=1 Tax=Algoriphagus taiwanensis TaxID=1445656 RepID=A0ABQ6Q6E2_9BACT|nr:hypothetical protein Ataiwa_40210 [Algoriphagus taiwanensis]
MNQKDTSFGLLIGETTAGLVQQPFAAMGAEVVKSSALLLSKFVLGRQFCAL